MTKCDRQREGRSRESKDAVAPKFWTKIIVCWTKIAMNA